MYLSFTIMAHPLRADRAAKLAACIDPLSTTPVVFDPEPDGPPSPWRTARLAWAAAPEWSTHHCVVQDDAIPCRNFAERVADAVLERPSDVIALFFGVAAYPLDTIAYRVALERCDHFYPIPQAAPWIPCVALVMPTPLALDLSTWQADHAAHHGHADDQAIGDWARSRGIRAYAACPSLVDHPDDAPSLMGPTQSFRRAICFADDATSDPI